MEEFNEIALQVPNQKLKRLALLPTRLMLLISILLALLELVRWRHRWVRGCWEGVPRRCVRAFIQVLLARHQAATVRHVTDRRWIMVLVALQLRE